MADFNEMQNDLGDFMPAGRLGPMVVMFGLLLFVALLVLLLVSGAHFTDEKSPVLTTPGTCAPFCGDAPSPMRTPPPPTS